MLRTVTCRALLASLALGCATLGDGDGERAFAIHVMDEAGRPVPCVRLTTPQQIVLTTDRAGVASFWEPGLMGREVFFTPTRAGWQHAADPTGLRGSALRALPGGSGTLHLEQIGEAPACDAGAARASARVPGREQLFRIDAIDAATRRGVPLIELRAPDGESWWTDSQGVIAFDDRASMGRRLRFEVRGDGYRSLDPSGFVELEPLPGGHAVIELQRLDIAERLYRVTGAGLYRDSVRLGLAVPIRQPLLNAGVAGQDSVQTVLYRGNLFWIWGDTPSVAHPLWNFHTSAATSQLPWRGGLDPALGVDLDYFVGPDGNVRAMTAIPGPGATWLTALVGVPDARGEETLFALYGKHTRLDPPAERGLARFDPKRQLFLRELVIEDAMPVQLRGSALRVRGADGDFVHYADDIRVPARAESLRDPTSWESFTPFPAPGAPAERGRGGEPRYAWRRGVPGANEAALREGRLAPGDALFGQVRDVESGEPVVVHANSTAANPYRARFVRIFTELEGSPSRLGEVWYAEGDTPMGPWRFARKILSHHDYSFYNPFHHVFFDQRGGRTLFFEGTYTAAFTKSAVPTPRYDYNQIMHRLDLEDPRLLLPVPIYDLGRTGRPERFADKRALRREDGDPPVAFFAHDRPAPGTVPVWWSGAACGRRRLVAGGVPATAPLFYAYTQEDRPAALRTLPLVADPPGLGSAASARPLGFVLENPLRVRLPVSAYLPESGADAGPDRCLREETPGAGARVVLDGAGSRGPRARNALYAWSWAGGSASGSRAEVRLPAGLHDVRLEITTPEAFIASDAVAIEVTPALTPR
ncbi:MAG TPA: hypothetical protein VII72_16250 [Myxococcota bacterium]|jgi:hypothetical protein